MKLIPINREKKDTKNIKKLDIGELSTKDFLEQASTKIENALTTLTELEKPKKKREINRSKTTLDVSEGDFYEMDEKLYFVKHNGDMYEIDFQI